MTAVDLTQIKQAKYIKLGPAGEWEDICFKDGTLRLGYWEVPSNFEPEQGGVSVAALYRAQGKNDQTATNHARQVLDFYDAGPETLWVTFANGRMYWAQALKPVEYLGSDPGLTVGSRMKQTIDGWHDTSLSGQPLLTGDLSGKLTRSAGYRQTICDIKGEAFDYLLNKLQDQDVPALHQAKNARSTILASIEQLIGMLTWQDFELFVDLIFTASGWRRIGAIGGTQKTVDIEVMLPLTDERASIQIKSQTSQQQLNEYAERLATFKDSRHFYVYHTADGILSAPPGITLLGRRALAEAAFRSGLADWLMKKTG